MPPSRRWSEELQGAGVTAAGWIAARRETPRLYAALPDATLDRLRTQHPEQVRATTAAAERIVGHEFDLLGSRPFTPRDPDRAAGISGYQPIDWYLDPIKGLRFPRGLRIADFNLETMRPGLADIKLPWELGRCQHWPVLGQAFQLTGDPRFAHEIAHQLEDFLEANPVGAAVNWSCTMDVALRAANWALALDQIASAPLPDSFWPVAYEALFDHGVFITRHLENAYEVTSNHFLSNVVGLFYVAAAFEDLPLGASWDAQCRGWLTRELDVQVLADGTDYESSVPYHRLVTELFLGAARLAEHRGAPFAAVLLERIGTMVEFLASAIRPDGLMPQVGDADDGRLHVFTEYGTWNPQDASHLFGPAACMFNRGDWLALGGSSGAWESLWWGLDPSRVDRAAVPGAAPLRHFPNAGITVMRHDRDYLLVTNGAVGTAGFGNHKHNDLLGFEFHVDGAPLVVDAGSYVYTSDPDARNLFRSTSWHNTVMVDRQEQNEFKPEWLFRMFERATPEHLEVADRGDTLHYRGRHNGYRRLPAPVTHERAFTWQLASRALEIADLFEGDGRHSIAWHFHFAPGVVVVLAGAGAIDLQTPTVWLRMTHPPDLEARAVEAWYSPSYGVRVPCTAVDFAATIDVSGRPGFAFSIEVR
jgi:hypothetical protein